MRHDFTRVARIRARASSQLMVSASPDSTSAILLSISAAQAASTSESLLSSRLAISSEASQARSFGGSANAVSRIVSALVLIDDQSSKSDRSREYGQASKPTATEDGPGSEFLYKDLNLALTYSCKTKIGPNIRPYRERLARQPCRIDCNCRRILACYYSLPCCP